jgi:uncharacterized protein
MDAMARPTLGATQPRGAAGFRSAALALSMMLLTLACSSSPKVVVKEESPAPEPKSHARKAIVVEKEEEPPPAGGPFIDLDWGTLRGLDPRNGQTTPLIDLAIGAPVRIAGYLVPFDDGTEETSEFLVVPSAGMCVHTPPPPANQMILARAQGRPAKMLTGAVWIYGKLDLQTGESPYGQTAYQMNADAIRPYK